MDGHDLHMALGKGLVRILVFVDAAFEQEAQEAVEQVEPDVLAVLSGDDGVVVVALEHIQQLGENRQVPGDVFVVDGALERVEGQQVVEVVGRAEV